MFSDYIRYDPSENTIRLIEHGELVLITYTTNNPTKIKMYKKNMGIVERIVT
jgi:hypothetical protein